MSIKHYDLVALEETIAQNNINTRIDEDIEAGTQELLQLWVRPMVSIDQ